jgi:hypothetical protein
MHSEGGTRHFTSEVILWAPRWYLAFLMSYRDLASMLPDQGVVIDHTTLFRWVQAYAATLEKRVRRHLRPCTGSWHVTATQSAQQISTDDWIFRNRRRLPGTIAVIRAHAETVVEANIRRIEAAYTGQVKAAVHKALSSSEPIGLKKPKA